MSQMRLLGAHQGNQLRKEDAHDLCWCPFAAALLLGLLRAKFAGTLQQSFGEASAKSWFWTWFLTRVLIFAVSWVGAWQILFKILIGQSVGWTKVYTKVVLSSERASASTGQKRGLVYTKSLVCKGNEGKNHIHQRAFHVFAGDLFTQSWCIDLGLLICSLSLLHRKCS